LLHQGDQIEKRLGIESAGRETDRVVQGRIGPVGPFARDTETAPVQLAKDQRVYTGYASFLEYFEALTPKRVERVADLRRSQMRTGLKCSSR
jgi:hypothetical protein